MENYAGLGVNSQSLHQAAQSQRINRTINLLWAQPWAGREVMFNWWYSLIYLSLSFCLFFCLPFTSTQTCYHQHPTDLTALTLEVFLESSDLSDLQWSCHFVFSCTATGPAGEGLWYMTLQLHLVFATLHRHAAVSLVVWAYFSHCYITNACNGSHHLVAGKLSINSWDLLQQMKFGNLSGNCRCSNFHFWGHFQDTSMSD